MVKVSKRKHHGVWILGEQSAGRVERITYELLRRGRELADKRKTELVAVIFGHRIDEGDLTEVIERGADRAVTMEAPELEHFLVEPYARCLAKVIQDHHPEIMIAGATSTGRTLMPYAAILVSAGLTADCTVLDIEPDTGLLLQTRPAIGGNILATIKTAVHRPQMATVRPRSTKPADRQSGRKGEIIRLQAPRECLASRIRRVGFEPDEAEHGLQETDIVVTAGRGIKKAENVGLIEELAREMDAAVGATRDVIDRGWMPYPHQIGLSGKTVTPKLYVGIGASGSIQHLAGMQTSETIVAVNIDPDAQIFNVADFGIVGDLFDVVPVLTKRIRKARKNT